MVSYRVSTPSTALVRVELLACPTRAQPEQMVAEVPSVQMHIYSGNSLCNSPTRAMLSQWKKHRTELIHLTNVFIYNGGKGEARKKQSDPTIEMQVCTAKSTYTIPTYRRAHRQTHTHTDTQKDMDLSTSCGLADTSRGTRRQRDASRIQSSLPRSSRQPKLASVSQTVQKAGGFSATSPLL